MGGNECMFYKRDWRISESNSSPWCGLMNDTCSHYGDKSNCLLCIYRDNIDYLKECITAANTKVKHLSEDLGQVLQQLHNLTGYMVINDDKTINDDDWDNTIVREEQLEKGG